jgi:hypothetical protein
MGHGYIRSGRRLRHPHNKVLLTRNNSTDVTSDGSKDYNGIRPTCGQDLADRTTCESRRPGMAMSNMLIEP